MHRRTGSSIPYILLACIATLLACGSPAMAQEDDDSLPLLAIPPIIGASLRQDTDGDGLPDVWEKNGYTENGTFVNLPQMGANPLHKDLFVWMDYMIRPDAVNLAPSQTVINNIITAFANAPVQNPDGTTGVNIHPVLGNQVTYVETLGVSGDYTQVWTQFDSLKQDFFNPAYAKAFRYMIWANTYNQGTSSGLARDIPAMDFIVSLGGWNTPGGTDWQKLGTFIHELGHCLGLTHGGSDHVNYKPNYLSIMSYFFQTSGLYRNGAWGDAGFPANYDYQRMNTPSLNENSLTEANGLSGADDVSTYGTLYYYDLTWTEAFAANAAGAIDWNKNSSIDVDPVSVDLNHDGSKTTLTAQNNWENINYSANGQIGPLAAVAAAQALRRTMPLELRDELDQETNQRLEQTRRTFVPRP